MINARAETAAGKHAFRAAYRARRCLIPADGFYEWERKGKVRQPFYFGLNDGALMAFAGLDAVGGGDNAHQSDAAGSIRTSARTEYQAASSAFAQLRAPEKAAKISAYPVEMAGFARKCRPNPGCAMKEKQRTADANKYHYVECGLPNVSLIPC